MDISTRVVGEAKVPGLNSVLEFIVYKQHKLHISAQKQRQIYKWEQWRQLPFPHLYDK